MSYNFVLLLEFTGMNVILMQGCAMRTTQNWESEGVELNE